MFSAIKEFLALAGVKYSAPSKAGDLAALMMTYKEKGQAARVEFSQLAQDFQAFYPKLELQRASNWMNQAQILRPHFWIYLKGFGELSEPMFALRLYGQESDFGVSLEVSFLERKKDDDSLIQQNRVLDLPIAAPLYYFAQIDGVSQRFEGTEANRQLLQEMLAKKQVRKVLVKQDINLSEAVSRESILEELQQAVENLIPYYEATRSH